MQLIANWEPTPVDDKATVTVYVSTLDDPAGMEEVANAPGVDGQVAFDILANRGDAYFWGRPSNAAGNGPLTASVKLGTNRIPAALVDFGIEIV